MRKATRDHKEIREWIENKGGVPEVLDFPAAASDQVGIRVDFPGQIDDEYLSDEARRRHDAGWGKFFEIFDKEDYVFMYDDEKFKTDPSMSFKFVKQGDVK